MAALNTRIGVNLLTCNLAHCPLHYQTTRFALDSLLDSDLQLYDWRLVVVDNDSNCPLTIQALQQLEIQDERVIIEWAEENLGIARGRNLGYQILQEQHAPQYVVEVHTDHVFPGMEDRHGRLGWLQPIIDYMEQPRHASAGIVGPSLITSGGQWRTPKLGYPDCVCPACNGRRRGQPYAEFRNEINKWARVWMKSQRVRPGLSHPAVKRWAMLEQTGTVRDGLLHPYDPDMPGRQNFEDTDEALTAHEAGWAILIHFGSVVYHHYHLTRLDATDHTADYNLNNAYVQEKHGAAVWDRWNATIGQWMERAYAK